MRRGFSLSEVLLALALLATVLVAAVVALQSSIWASHRQQMRAQAAFLAQQKMEEVVAATSPPTPSQGSFPEPHHEFRWQVEVWPQDASQTWRLTVEVMGPGGARFPLVSERRKQPRRLLVRTGGGWLEVDEMHRHPSPLDGLPSCQEFCLNPDGEQVVSTRSVAGLPQPFLSRLHQPAPARPLFEHPGGVREPRYSPDGKQLAFAASQQGRSQIFVWDFLAKKARLWRSSSHNDTSPAWMPGSKGLVVCRDGSSLVLLDEQRERVLVSGEGFWNAAPEVTPDGRSLVFLSNRQGAPQLYRFDFADQKLQALSHQPGGCGPPRVSPDGRRLLAQDLQSRRPIVLNLDGSEVQILDWLPDRVDGVDWWP